MKLNINFLPKSIKFLILIFCTLPSFAQVNLNLQSIFDEANVHFEKESYDKAIEEYEKLVGLNVQSVPLFYNLGNTYFRNDDIANSIYYFEKAKKLAPYDEDIQNNLNLVYGKQLDDIDKFPELLLVSIFKKAANIMTSNAWFYASLILIWLSLLSFFFISKLKFRNTSNKRGHYLWTVLLVAGLLFSLLSYVKYNNDYGSESAVLFEKEAIVYTAPNQNSEEIITIHEGLKFKVKDAVDKWTKVELSDGTSGWIKKEWIKII